MLLLFLAVAILLGGAFAFPFIRFSMVSSTKPESSGPVLIAGHRGAATLAPENTMAAFRAGMASADMIELDVHLSGDGEVIVAHDPTADRTTNGAGAWKDLTLDEIKKLDAGSWFGASFTGEKIPTLDEVLTLVNGKCIALIELKWPESGIYDGLTDKVVNLIRKNNAEQWTAIQSFEISYLHEIAAVAPDITSYELIYGVLNFPPVWQDRYFHVGYFQPLSGVDGVVCNYSFASTGLIRKIHARRMKAGAYTVNDSDDVNRLMRMGVDLIITDDPGRMRPK